MSCWIIPFSLSSSASAPINHQRSQHCCICHFSLQHSNKKSDAAVKKQAQEEQVILPDPFSLGKRERSPNLSPLIHSTCTCLPLLISESHKSGKSYRWCESDPSQNYSISIFCLQMRNITLECQNRIKNEGLYQVQV